MFDQPRLHFPGDDYFNEEADARELVTECRLLLGEPVDTFLGRSQYRSHSLGQNSRPQPGSTDSDQLALVEQHVAKGETHIGHQEQIVAKLDSSGLQTDQAIRLLENLRRIQEEHIAHRNRLLRSGGKFPIAYPEA
jgi:hypothetical protein